MKNPRFLHNSRIPFALASAIAAMFATQVAHAATGTWNVDADGLWSNAANWTPGIADGSGFTANFTNNITADRTVSLDSARTLGSLVFGDSATATAGSWTVNNNGNAANTLTGLGTITVNALGTGKTATISAVIAGSAPITTSGGTLVLSGANTLNKTDSNNASFAWRLNAGTVVIASNSAFGVSTGTGFNATTLVNLNGATLQASGSARTVANPLWLNASTTTVSGSESLTFSGTASGRGGNATVTNNITGGGTLSFTGNVYTDFTTGFKTLTFGGTGNTLISGVIANNTGNVAGQNGAIAKSGAGTLTLSNTASTYTGLTTINAGVMEVAVLANGGTASSIGQSTNAASNLVFAAPTATLRYNGSSNSTTNRGFTLSSGTGGGATIESSGSGTLTIDNTIALAYGTTGQTRLITLGGTNTGANTFSKVIADNGSGATSLTKAGAGQWVIGGTNTYTGATNVNAGTLLINGSTSSTSLVTVGVNGTLGGTGTVGGNTTISGTHSPGNSPGIQTFSGNLSYVDAGIPDPTVNWELANNTTTVGANPTAAFDQIIVGGNLDFTNLTSINLSFNGAGSGVLWADALWDANQSWLLYDVAGSTTNFANLNLNTINWLDSGSNLFSNTGGSFSLGQIGQDVVLNYTVIPEPNVAALLGGLGMLALLRRRR